MKKYIRIIVLMGMLYSFKTYSQVGMTTNAPDKNAVLDLTDGSGTKGLLLPKVVLTGTDSFAPLTAHVAGMHIYNTATAGSGATAVTPGEYYNDGAKWVRIPSSAWLPDGNNNGAFRSIGTIDAFDIPVETNGTEKMRITSDGQVLVNTATPLTGGDSAKLQINSATPGAIQIKDGTENLGYVLQTNANGVASWKSAGSFGTLGTKTSLSYSGTSSVILTDGATYTLSAFTVPKTGWYKISSRMFFFQANLNSPYGSSVTFKIDTVSANNMYSGDYILETRRTLNGDAANVGEGALVYMIANTSYYIHYAGFNVYRHLEQNISFTYMQ